VFSLWRLGLALAWIIELANQGGWSLGPCPDEQNAAADSKHVDRVPGRQAHAPDDLHPHSRRLGQEPTARDGNSTENGKDQRDANDPERPRIGAARASSFGQAPEQCRSRGPGIVEPRPRIGTSRRLQLIAARFGRGQVRGRPLAVHDGRGRVRCVSSGARRHEHDRIRREAKCQNETEPQRRSQSSMPSTRFAHRQILC
jgi:hypothetical protein